MEKNDLLGTWSLTNCLMKVGEIAEEWHKKGLMIFTNDDYISISVNYTGDVTKDLTKKTGHIVIRDFFAAGRFTLHNDGHLKIQHMYNCIPQWVNQEEKRHLSLRDNQLIMKISKNNMLMETRWTKL